MTRTRQIVKWAGVVATSVLIAYMGATAWRGLQLLEQRTPLIEEIRSAEQRSQCYFTLIAERSLVRDPEVADQMARDYLEGRRCPAAGPTSPP